MLSSNYAVCPSSEYKSLAYDWLAERGIDPKTLELISEGYTSLTRDEISIVEKALNHVFSYKKVTVWRKSFKSVEVKRLVIHADYVRFQLVSFTLQYKFKDRFTFFVDYPSTKK